MAEPNTKHPVTIKAARELEPKSFLVAERGVRTAKDLATLMSALMADVLAMRVTSEDAKAVCGGAQTLLKVVELQYKYGKDTANGGKELSLTE